MKTFKAMGILIILRTDFHYSNVIFPKNVSTKIFYVGNPLPDMLYKLLNIDKTKWEKMSYKQNFYHNLNMIKQGTYLYMENMNRYKKSLLTFNPSCENVNVKFNSIPSCNYSLCPAYVAMTCINKSAGVNMKRTLSNTDGWYYVDVLKDD